MILLRVKMCFLLGFLIVGLSVIGCGGGGGGSSDTSAGDENGDEYNSTVSIPYIGGVPYKTQSQVNTAALCNKFCSPSFLRFDPAACAVYCPNNVKSEGISYLNKYLQNGLNRVTSEPAAPAFIAGYSGSMSSCLKDCYAGWECRDVGGEAKCVPE